MRYALFASSLLLSSITVLAQVSVVEPETKSVLVDGRTTISLALRNRAAQPVSARIELRWLSPDEEADGVTEGDFSVRPGDSTISIAHPLSENCDPMVERLEYRVSPSSQNYTAFAPFSGVLSLPSIAENAFTIGVLTVGFPVPGQPFEIRVLAAHPLTGRPAAGVKVSSGDVTAFTGADGIALLRVIRTEEDDGSIEVTGELGDFKVEAESTPLPNKKDEIRAYTDKPIYQPGQTMHIRILALDPSGHAIPDRDFDLRTYDQSGELAFSANVNSSRLGIASADWEIPQTVTPGRYMIALKTDEAERYFLRYVSIRAYELPSFRVTAAPDRPFYLVNEPAKIEVRGEYLFGKPVSSGTVRLVAADDEKNAIAEGPLDSGGRFHAAVEIEAELPEYLKFKDYHYIAFLTDGSTNRTEQRKFDIRVSRDPIHIYAIRLESHITGRQIYLTAYSPDGAPLRSDIEVAHAASVLGRGKTNRFGVAKIDLPPAGADDDDQELEIRAATGDGLRAGIDITSRDFHSHANNGSGVWVQTDRAIYHSGDVIKCIIESGVADQQALLLGVNEKEEVVFTQSLSLKRGSTSFEIPHDKRFGRALTLGVLTSASAGFLPVRRVYFPGPGDLALKATASKSTYRPGDTVKIQFDASAQAALGIAIVDQSVLERAATDNAFGRGSWFEDRDARGTNLGGVAEADLLSLAPALIDDPDLQLVADALPVYNLPLFNNTADVTENIREAFEKLLSEDLKPVLDGINQDYQNTLEFPRDDASLERVAGYHLHRILDPWRQPYSWKFSISDAYSIITLVSNGPDKKRDTADDIVGATVRRKWFAPEEALIGRALRGAPDYPATPDAFVRLLNSIGLRFDALRDPWGGAMRVEISHWMQSREIRIISAGPDGVFGGADDFTAAAFRGSYFAEVQASIDRVLRAAPQLPATAEEFRALLSGASLDLDSVRDPWGHPYYLAFRDNESFTDQVQLYTYAEYNRATEERKQITPVKQTTRTVEVRSVGSDGISGTYDDFAVASFRRILSLPKPPATAEAPLAPAATLNGTGSIAGTVVDLSGAVVPNAELELNDSGVTHTDGEGRFMFSSLPPGEYRISCTMQGFQKHVLSGIPVFDAEVTHVELTLRVGAAAETVEVSAAPAPLSTSASMAVSSNPGFTISTPRVRDYFPETLYWQPELVTDSAGRASVQVKLADSVTTWHVAAVGSTVDGRIAEASTDIRAFQPFVIDLDVPRSLTAGDEISIPVPLRNYLERAQKVAVTAKLPPELRLLEAVRQPGAVPPSSSANSVLALRAETPAREAPVRVTAVGGSASDAIEKLTAIHPDGERRTSSISSVIGAGDALAISVPGEALAGSIQGEVKIYPSMLARTLEAMEQLLETPHGCGEQTISLTYSNLLLLKALKEAGLADDPLGARAMKNLRAGYHRLLAYQDANGGFTYWGHGDTDVAVTAYALEFLGDAQAFIAVDEDVVKRARQWLAKQTADEPGASALRMRALAGSRSENSDVDRQLGELARKAAEYGDPYAIAAFALAAMEANKPDLAGPAIDQLSRAAQDERSAAWWALRANTPFHGWGRWGQVETTAMAVSALSRWRKLGHGDAALSFLIDRGALFLLRNTAEDGGWATSQSAARALMALLEAQSANDTAEAEHVQIRVNGNIAGTFTIPGGRTVGAPLRLDVSRMLHAGENRISFAGFRSSGRQAQFTAAWYEKWGPKRPDKNLDMQVRYSTLDAAVNDAIACDVTISRDGFRGYGMMIAEVGLPPGAEVDRGVLEQIIGDWKSGVNSYEVAPDHVTFYVWPRAADIKLRFLFRPRFAMKARAAQSTLYDFYNPDSRVVLAPEKFVIRH